MISREEDSLRFWREDTKKAIKMVYKTIYTEAYTLIHIPASKSMGLYHILMNMMPFKIASQFIFNNEGNFTLHIQNDTLTWFEQIYLSLDKSITFSFRFESGIEKRDTQSEFTVGGWGDAFVAIQ